jgi:tRNA threonylcarbamoyladenosine dehydratase
MTGDSTSRTELMLGRDGVDRLKDSFVILVGAGAVGGYVLEGLVRAGVGKIRVIDDHCVDESNLNRQILATRDTVGRPKAIVATERARSINPDIDIEGLPELINVKNVSRLLGGEPDIIVDAIDTVANKVFVLRYAAENRIRTFSSMGAALRTDTTKIRINTLKRTRACPLASAMRDGLRDLNTSMITCVYSEEPIKFKPTERDEHMKSRLGSLPTLPAIFGLTVANEAIMYLSSPERDIDGEREQ